MNTFWHNLEKPFTVLAPMEDVTDTVFRRIIADCGRPDIFVTEFTSADGLCSEGRLAVSKRLLYTEVERPLVAQIWGNNPSNYYKAAKMLKEQGFNGIDINMGCPVQKIVKNGCCSALIDNPALAKELVVAAIEGAEGLPVSVKTRIGFKKKVTEKWASFLLELKLPVLTFHARTSKQMSKVPAEWDEIKKIVNLRKEISPETLIIGNGDIISLEDGYSKASFSNVDGLMIGRGVFKDPFIFNKNTDENFFVNLDPKIRLSLLLKHSRLHEKVWANKKPFKILKKFYKIYVSDFRGASELRSDLMQTNTLVEVEKVIAQWLDVNSHTEKKSIDQVAPAT